MILLEKTKILLVHACMHTFIPSLNGDLFLLCVLISRDLVLVGRSTILIKGISDRLNIPWSLAKEWAPIARDVLNVNMGGKDPNNQKKKLGASPGGRVRFRTVLSTVKSWSKGRAKKVATKLPSSVRSRLAAYVVRREERKSRKKLMR